MFRACRARRWLGSAAACVIAMLAWAAHASASEIRSAGPLTLVGTSPDLNCYVNHAADAVPEFYGTTACGTFVAAGGVLYGPSSCPACGSASPRTSWTRVSEGPVAGTGAATDPYRMTTVVTGGPLRVSQVDSYVVGRESYRTDATVTNEGDEELEITLYRAGDCYLQNSDYGFGRVDSGAPSCLERAPHGGPGSRIEQFAPITAGSHHYHAGYSEVWAWIGSRRPFPDTCRCTTYMDNGAGLSWTRTLAPGASVTLSSFITFSPIGNLPISISKVPDQEEVAPGGVAGYTIQVTNPNSVEVRLEGLTDDHSAGFMYIPGSTSGVTEADPVITDNRLSWGPFDLPPNSDIHVHFSMRVPETPGTYVNLAGGEAPGYTIIPAEEPPPVEVSEDPEQALEGELIVEKAADEDPVTAGGRASYTITLNNPNPTPLRIARVTEVMADGVRYVPGSTTDLTTEDPEIDGQRLTWRVDAETPPMAAVKLRFQARMPLADERRVLLNPRVTAVARRVEPGEPVERVDVLPATDTAHIHLLPQPILGGTRLRKEPSRRVVSAGETVRFDLTVRDLAPKTPTTATICARIPRELRLVRARPTSREARRLCWRRRLPAGVSRARVSYVARARLDTRGRVRSSGTATATRRDPSRDVAGVRVVAPQPPPVTG
jgi:uncharacterized repeat protein (TIGR01451 family)